MTNHEEEILEKFDKVLDTILPDSSSSDYPKCALPLGTFIRSKRLNRLGVVLDAFHSGTDEDSKPIIVYTTLLFPNRNTINSIDSNDKFYMSNEYEYEIIGYLMVKPIDIKKLMKNFREGFMYED